MTTSDSFVAKNKVNLSGATRTPIAREGVKHLVKMPPDAHAGLIAEVQKLEAFEELMGTKDMWPGVGSYCSCFEVGEHNRNRP